MTDHQKDLSSLIDSFEFVHAPVIARVFMTLAKEMHGRDLSFAQMDALMGIFMTGPKSISDIAAAGNMTHYNASRMVDRLVKQGFFSRIEDVNDRRQKRVELTDRGRAVPEEFRNSTRRAFNEVLRGLPEDLLARLAVVMAEVDKHLPPIPAPRSPDATGGPFSLPPQDRSDAE